MSVAITNLRTALAEAVRDDSQWQVFAFPPQNILANSVVVVPDNPYLSPSNGHYSSISPMAHFKLIITVPMLDNEGNLQGIENNVVAVFTLLDESSLSFNIGEVSAPSILNAASGDLLTCEMSVSILTSWS